MSVFQSTPRFVGEGNPRPTAFHSAARGSFNPPPALSARGTYVASTLGHPIRVDVSIHPPLCRRGNMPDSSATQVVLGDRSFSIHPPLCRRGEPTPTPTPVAAMVFQSTPRFVGEGASRGRQDGQFQSTPLCRRGERHRCRFRTASASSFNPPPALSAGNARSLLGAPRSMFQSTPRFVGEGNCPLYCPCRSSDRVPTPALSARELYAKVVDFWCFNPPPALSARGNVFRVASQSRRSYLRFNPPPPLCRRGGTHA